MYNNVGKKIMKIAQWYSLVMNIICFIAAIACISNEEYTAALIAVAVGALTTVASWPVYGFGQLVDDVHALRGQSAEPVVQNDELPEL